MMTSPMRALRASVSPSSSRPDGSSISSVMRSAAACSICALKSAADLQVTVTEATALVPSSSTAMSSIV